MQETLNKYIKSFKRLRIDRAHGIAPHKPILLISVLQAFENNLVTTNRIYITPELVALFKANWSLFVNSNHDCRFALPFYHLTSDGFWRLIPRQGFENILLLPSSMRSFANLNVAVEYAEINNDLFQLMKDEASNKILIQFLLDEYFPNTKSNFHISSEKQQQLFNDLEERILNDSPEEYRQEIKKLMKENNEEEIYIRGILFKREIPKIYNNTCCISGMRISAIANVSMIDACHIIPFSESLNDTIKNGIALCPNLHRAFDRGLITIDNNYKVIVSTSFKEDESCYGIHIFSGKQILLPRHKDHFPLKENFEWHKNNIFKA